ncbi:MAG: hypothetical protein EB060_04180 [Proteobacteria bacterium]|nr:hypothetical protein [Pseudomonadota bacterium]
MNDMLEKITNTKRKRVYAFTLFWIISAVAMFFLGGALPKMYWAGVRWNELIGWSSYGSASYPIALLIYLYLDDKLKNRRKLFLPLLAIALLILCPLTVIVAFKAFYLISKL